MSIKICCIIWNNITIKPYGSSCITISLIVLKSSIAPFSYMTPITTIFNQEYTTPSTRKGTIYAIVSFQTKFLFINYNTNLLFDQRLWDLDSLFPYEGVKSLPYKLHTTRGERVQRGKNICKLLRTRTHELCLLWWNSPLNRLNVWESVVSLLVRYGFKSVGIPFALPKARNELLAKVLGATLYVWHKLMCSWCAFLRVHVSGT